MRQKTRASPNQDDSVAGSEQDSIGVVGWACWSPQAGEGLRDGFRRLRRLGLRTQALKSALAAGLAWAVGAYVPWGPAQPYLAPLTAILTIQATIAESLQGALQRVLGVAVGVGMAVIASHTMGVSSPTVALLVVLSQALGSLLGLTIVGTSQVVISALLVLTIGETTANGWLYGWGRISETMVGAAIGIIVNGLVVPPSYLHDTRRAWETLAAELHDQIDALAAALDNGLTPGQAREALKRARTLGAQLDSARTSLGQAERSLRFNYFARSQRQHLGQFALAIDTLEHVAIQLRGICRTLVDLPAASGTPDLYPHWLAPDALGCPLGALFRSAGDTLGAVACLTTAEQPVDVTHGQLCQDATDRQARPAAAEARDVALSSARTLMPTMESASLIALGSILADLDRMIGELSATVTDSDS